MEPVKGSTAASVSEKTLKSGHHDGEWLKGAITNGTRNITLREIKSEIYKKALSIYANTKKEIASGY